MANKKRPGSISFFGAGLTTTASITLVLLLLGLTVLVGFMGSRLSSFVKENLTITIEIPDKMKEAEIKKQQAHLEESPFVKKIRYVSKEEIKEHLIADLGRDPEEILGFNPASSCFEINLKAEYANTDSVRVIEQILKSKNITQGILYSQDDLDMVNANLSKIGTGLLLFALVLMFISFTLIRNTIRLSIYAKRFLINTMQLVGATSSFIRRPFLLQMVTCGIIATVFANVLITLIVYYFTKEYAELLAVVRLEDLVIIYGSVLVLGIFLTFTATSFAVNRYLRMSTNNLYYI